MILEEMSALHNPWCWLQQPAHPFSGLNASFRTLLAAIDQGWEVVEPILKVDGDACDAKAYDFILFNQAIGKTLQIRVIATPEVEDFIGNNGYEKSNYSFS